MSAPGRSLQWRRRILQAGFFALFILAPPLDLLRFDLNLGYLIFLGQPWTLGIDPFRQGEIEAAQMALQLLLYGFLPLALVAGALLYSAWRWGRLYCGWLCPHFSVVEMVNGAMLRAGGKPSLWEPKPLPLRQPDGRVRHPHWIWWPITWLLALFFALLWAVALLTYLLPPAEIYGNLWRGELSMNQFRFILVATAIFLVEFLFARHLFCRFGCAVGLFQSLAWMANDRAMVVGFDTSRARECSTCNNACDNVCPMRLKPRTIKRKMFTCTECAQCISACTTVQREVPAGSLLRWVDGGGEGTRFESL